MEPQAVADAFNKVADALEKSDEYIKALEERVDELEESVAKVKEQSLMAPLKEEGDDEEEDAEEEDDAIKVAREIYRTTSRDMEVGDLIRQVEGLSPEILAKLAGVFSSHRTPGIQLGKAARKHARYNRDSSGQTDSARERLISFFNS